MQIKIAGIMDESIVDGPGIRFTIFTQGCPHNCEGCHNPETHDFYGGKLSDTDRILSRIEENPLIQGVTFSGGEPFCQPEPLAEIAEKLKDKNYHIICFTGYTFEQLYSMKDTNSAIKKLLDNIDILIDGKFVLAERSLELRFKGSRNQRTIDVKESMKQGKAVIIEI